MTGYYSQDDMIHEVDLREESTNASNWIRMMQYTCAKIDRRCCVTGPAGEAFLADLAQEPDAFLKALAIRFLPCKMISQRNQMTDATQTTRPFPSHQDPKELRR